MLRIRKATLDEAQKAVGEAYQKEQEADTQAQAAAASLEREMKAATSLVGGDDAVESFARWLPVGRRTVEQARNAQKAATTELDRARALLTLARAAVSAVESLIEQRQLKEHAEEGRKEQLVLDELGRRQI